MRAASLLQRESDGCLRAVRNNPEYPRAATGVPMPMRSLLFVFFTAAALAACGGRTPLDMPEDVPGFDASDTPRDRVGDVPVMGCRSNADCTGSPATPVC